MAGTPLDRELQLFAVELFERAGGVADWPVPEAPGSVVVPAEIAAAAQLPGEEFSLGLTAVAGSLHVNLAGEFLDTASRILEFGVPRDGSFCIPDRYLTRRDLTEKIGRTFTWLNARAKCGTAEPALVSYHLWMLHGTLKSEDAWEGLFRFTVNEESGAIVELPDVFQEPDLHGETATGEGCDPAPASYDAAIAEGKRRLMSATADFVGRSDERLQRDRKRLHDYYKALLRDADGPKRRTAAPPSPADVAARKRAVDLELRRKLAELDEQYAMRATLRPVTVARVRLPALVVPIMIQRKQATRGYRLYWSALAKQLEPLACSRCRRPTFVAAFTNETVDLLCKDCQARENG
jgi:hypothetical protein